MTPEQFYQSQVEDHNRGKKIEKPKESPQQKKISGSVSVKVESGMKARINPKFFEGQNQLGKVFVIDSVPRVLCGTEVVALNNLDGTRFSASYDLSMLEVTDLNA